MADRSSTAWLDGCRGYAALGVVFYHFFAVYLPSIRYAYGSETPIGYQTRIYLPQGVNHTDNDPNLSIIADPSMINNRHWYMLPIMRLFTCGDPMVGIFFVLSGYALSIRPLKLMHQGINGRANFAAALASSVWRRPIRLLGPAIISTLFIAIMAWASCFSTSYKAFGFEANHYPPIDAQLVEARKYFRGPNYENPPNYQINLMAQLYDWAISTSHFLNPFEGRNYNTAYDHHLWTIPEEFKCSIILYVTHAGTALLRPRYRIIVMSCFLIHYFVLGYQWVLALFWAGMLLCEVDMQHPPRKPTYVAWEKPTIVRWSFSCLWSLLFVISLYIQSYPQLDPHMTIWFGWMSSICGDFRKWQSLGAVLMILSVGRVPTLQAFFSNAVASYLGRISYALYLLHGPVFRSLGYTVFIAVLNHSQPDPTWQQYHRAVAISFVATFPVAIGAAHLFCRLVDEPLVRFAKWSEQRVFVKTTPWTKQEDLHLQHLPEVAENAGFDSSLPRRSVGSKEYARVAVTEEEALMKLEPDSRLTFNGAAV